jgi:hypothetical protein
MSSKIRKKQGDGECARTKKKGTWSRSPYSFPEADGLLNALDVHSIDAFATFHLLEFYAIVLTYLLEQAAVVYEYLLFGVVGYNEAISLGFIEELDSSGFHVVMKLITKHLSPEVVRCS